MTKRFILNIAKFMLGAVFLLFGVNYFFDFMPLETLERDAAHKFMAGLHSAQYFMPFLKVVEIVCGLLLISGFYTALTLVILMPINLNIFMFNLFLNPVSLPLSLVMMIAHLYLAWIHRNHYSALFRNKL